MKRRLATFGAGMLTGAALLWWLLGRDDDDQDDGGADVPAHTPVPPATSSSARSITFKPSFGPAFDGASWSYTPAELRVVR